MEEAGEETVCHIIASSCVHLSLRHGGARMLFTREEKEIPYPVGLVIFIEEKSLP